MNVLFDFISIQGTFNGGAEYTKRVLEEICRQRIFSLYALYDSQSIFSFNPSDCENYSSSVVEWIDLAHMASIAKIVEEKKIDVFFIGIAQRYMYYDLSNIRCRSVVVLHDLVDYELSDNKIGRLFEKENRSIKKTLKSCLKRILVSQEQQSVDSRYSGLCKFISNDWVQLVTVSNFSAHSIRYYFPDLHDKTIYVLYSPMKEVQSFSKLKEIEQLKAEGCNYFLLLNANRDSKNAAFVLDVFERYAELYPQDYLVTTGLNHKVFKNHIPLSYISSGQLEYALKFARALIYASTLEGFGYPPLEAMKYGTPVVSANVCSMPELLGDAAAYFSPFYRSDLFNALCLFDKSRVSYSGKAILKYAEIEKKQIRDLSLLLKLIEGEIIECDKR